MFYRPAEKKKVLAVSYSHYFGETRFAASQSYKQWHTMLHDEVGDKWGLARGEDTSLMTAEERKEHRKKNKRQLERERLEALKKAEEAEKKAQETEKKIDQAAWALDNFESSLAEKREASSRLNYMIDNARQELNRINKEKETARNVKNELELRARELADAVGDPSESVAFNGFCDAVFTYNPKSGGAIICSSGTLTGLPLFLNLVAEVAVITNCPRRKTMRTNCFSPSDVIRWPRLCMHQSIGSGDNRTNVAIEFRIRCLWMLGE